MAPQLRRSKRIQASATIPKPPINAAPKTAPDNDAAESTRSKRKLPASTPPETSKKNIPAARKRTRQAVQDQPKPHEKAPPLSQRKDENEEHLPPTTEPAPRRTQSPSQPLPPFLALPRELRDEIYKHILAGDDTTQLKSGPRNLATRCGLIGVNNQLCEEFLDAVMHHAPVISTTVRNHNFAHVVTFLNRLSERQLARLERQEAVVRGRRRINILLQYTAGGASGSRANLNRWLDRFDVPEKRGRDIDFVYRSDETYRNGGYKQRPKARSTASARWNQEAKKIGQASAMYKQSGHWDGW